MEETSHLLGPTMEPRPSTWLSPRPTWRSSILLDHGSDIDKPDKEGWTPRRLADQQDHEEIKAIFASLGEPNNKVQHVVAIPEGQQRRKIRYLGGSLASLPHRWPHEMVMTSHGARAARAAGR
ncbi:hypothetical protein K1719_003233 [Acacia pycnantha]|nr:hypothetical protein K1719_003233 [Acacia pycnantha]